MYICTCIDISVFVFVSTVLCNVALPERWASFGVTTQLTYAHKKVSKA